MKRVRVLILVCFALLLTAAVAAPAAAQAEFTCDSGGTITNGVAFTLNIRPGDYLATVIGLNGFDPVMAVVEAATGGHICNDDEPAAAGYAASLPTTGDVPASSLSSQVSFSNTGNDFLDIVLAVGGLNGTPGEFILLFQGMQVTEADGEGDPFAINASPNVVNSGVGINAYIVHVDANFDPLLKVVDGNNQVVEISSGAISCDDAGNPDSCWTAGGSVVSLEGYGFTDGTNTAVGDPYDPYISIPASLLDASLPYEEAFINFLVTGAQYQQGMSTGEYIFAIHTGIADASGSSGSTGNVIPQGQPGGPAVTQEPSGSSTTAGEITPIDCSVTGQQISGDVNTFLNVECPANCTRGGLWGTTIYTDDSAVCTAGIHAGVIPASGGQFSLVIADGQTSYEGTTANGITSSNWGTFGRSIMPTPIIDQTGPSTSGSTGSTGSNGTTSTDVTLQAIAYGDTVNAQIGSVAGDAYSFNASARDVVTIAVNSEDFDPLIIVTDTNGRELSRDDDSGDGFNALVSNLRIPNDGEYIIVVTSFSGTLDPGTAYAIELSGG